MTFHMITQLAPLCDGSPFLVVSERLPFVFTESLVLLQTATQYGWTHKHTHKQWSTGPVGVSMKAEFPPYFLSSSIMVSLGHGEAPSVNEWMEEHCSFSNSPIRATEHQRDSYIHLLHSHFSFPLFSFVFHAHYQFIFELLSLYKNIIELNVFKPMFWFFLYAFSRKKIDKKN